MPSSKDKDLSPQVPKYYSLGVEKGKGYSYGLRIREIVENGWNNQDPPSNLWELLDGLIGMLEVAQSEWSESISINSLDIFSSKYIHTERLSEEKVCELLTEFLDKINDLNLSITLSLDLTPELDFQSYTEYQPQIDLFNHLFSTLISTRMKSASFNPEIILNLHDPSIYTHPTLDPYLKLAFTYGVPIIQNKLTGTVRSVPTRPSQSEPQYNIPYLRLGGPTGNADGRGVLNYACINLAHLGYDAQSEEHFFQSLEEQIQEATAHLDEHRAHYQELLDEGKLSNAEELLVDPKWLLSVISLVGMNEALQYLVDAPLGHVVGKAVTYKTLEFLLRQIEDIQIDTGNLYTLETYPSDGPGSMLLEQSGLDLGYLTTGTELSPTHGDDLWDVFEHQKKFHSLYMGGTLMEIHQMKPLIYHSGCKLLIQKTIEIFGYNYLAISPRISLNGVEYIRVDGKTIPLSDAHESLKEAHRKRVPYDIKNR